MNKLSDFLIVDGKTYNVSVLSIEREAPILDKFAERTEDGNLQREVIGTYYNYTIKFGSSHSYPDDYDALYEILTAPDDFHDITVPYGHRGSHSYKAYISNVKDSISAIRGDNSYWENLSASFIAQKPART